MHYDIIGDIHGHADQLKALLNRMGYQSSGKSYGHPERKVIFVGDYIDRGPAIPETVEIVRSMAENNNAIALMGNHEFNAILYNTKDKKGNYRREHIPKNEKQHKDTIHQFQKNASDYDAMIDWFRTLPFFFEDENIRVIHAFWDSEMVQDLTSYLTNDQSLKDDYWMQAGEKGTNLYNLIENLLKGKEVPLPSGIFFEDKGRHKRTDVRIKWWESPENKTFREWGIAGMGIELPKEPIPEEYKNFKKYQTSEKPVFFGHYWMTGIPALQKNNVCCLDFSVAKNGVLCGYQHHGEKILSQKHLMWVE